MEDSFEEKIVKLQEKIRQAELERDVWQGKSASNFTMASHMVNALRKQLTDLKRPDAQ